ncbi:hypothetical protein PFFCH_02631 [Plasmodium falciparum FCH/4]|uniref:Uncharacterized protein n=1 Tax=Plasmodium falciparum FCH/4 TaxID=1036724 RepID=A0A024VNJ6_PLAFA|nr:hypothetical protein PFFCH_02631 [Plasmodium falciparum FCH/4]
MLNMASTKNSYHSDTLKELYINGLNDVNCPLFIYSTYNIIFEFFSKEVLFNNLSFNYVTKKDLQKIQKYISSQRKVPKKEKKKEKCEKCDEKVGSQVNEKCEHEEKKILSRTKTDVDIKLFESNKLPMGVKSSLDNQLTMGTQCSVDSQFSIDTQFSLDTQFSTDSQTSIYNKNTSVENKSYNSRQIYNEKELSLENLHIKEHLDVQEKNDKFGKVTYTNTKEYHRKISSKKIKNFTINKEKNNNNEDDNNNNNNNNNVVCKEKKNLIIKLFDKFVKNEKKKKNLPITNKNKLHILCEHISIVYNCNKKCFEKIKNYKQETNLSPYVNNLINLKILNLSGDNKLIGAKNAYDNYHFQGSEEQKSSVQNNKKKMKKLKRGGYIWPIENHKYKKNVSVEILYLFKNILENEEKKGRKNIICLLNNLNLEHFSLFNYSLSSPFLWLLLLIKNRNLKTFCILDICLSHLLCALTFLEAYLKQNLFNFQGMMRRRRKRMGSIYFKFNDHDEIKFINEMYSKLINEMNQKRDIRGTDQIHHNNIQNNDINTYNMYINKIHINNNNNNLTNTNTNTCNTHEQNKDNYQANRKKKSKILHIVIYVYNNTKENKQFIKYIRKISRSLWRC